MDNCTYLKAMELFEVPEKFYDLAKSALTEKEVELIVLMGKEKHLASDLEDLIIQKGISKDAKELIKSAYNRAVLKKIREDGKEDLYYAITNLYKRIFYYAQYEYDEWKNVPKEIKMDIFDWGMGIYCEDMKEFVNSKMNDEYLNSDSSYFITLKEAIDLVDKQDLIYVVPCNCKASYFHQDKPVNVCLWFKNDINYELDRGHGEIISKEKAKELLVEANKKGLMQSGDDTCICNCDGLCCYPINLARKLNTRPYYPKSNYEIIWHEDQCVNCGKCTKICNFGAFYLDEDRKVQYDPQKCWECTICAENCPKKAIEYKKKRKE